MPKKNQSPLYQINFHCFSCQQDYQTVSTSAQDIKVASCGNCVYPGASASEVKVGAVEKFRQRMKKVQAKKN